jgi:predicted ATPase/DNA-binding SARP family transcriptional activator
VRIDLLGVVAVAADGREVSGAALGGRRARVALAALALADGPVRAEQLAETIWGDDLPATWQPALRGIIRGLRTALGPVGGGDQRAIATAPSGYRLASGVEVDVRQLIAGARRAAALLAEGRHRAALELAQPAAEARGSQLLPDEDAGWLEPHRNAVDAAAADAWDVVSVAASELGEHAHALDAARRAVAAHSLDERAHRTLIRALDRAGDRAGAVQAYEQCRAALADQLGIDPSGETVAVYLAALADQNASASARVPAATTSFVGRAGEAEQLAMALNQPGLVTVIGRGGVGKSRLAARAAAQGTFAGGRLWVPLATVGEDALVAAAVALELGVAVGVDDGETALAEYLAPLGRTLLVLDGGDVILDGTASLVATLTASCPALTVLVTSRVPLGLDAETVLVLAPLPAPDGSDATTLRDNPQVRLLVDRVRAGGGVLEVDAASGELIAALCRRCDGLPLALEIAAAQLTAMPVGDLLDQLAEVDVGHDDRLRAIARGSYELLDPDEAAVFRRFGVLDGPVGLPLARAVVAGDQVPPVRVVRILRELSVRGLISVDRSGARWRYQQDDDLHRFARELLVAEGGEAAAFDRLAAALRALLPDDARLAPAPFAADVTAVLGSVRALFGAAIDGRADRDRCLELAFRLHRYWAATGVAEGRFWLARLLAVAGESPWTRYATYALGYLSYWTGDADDALRDLQAAVAMFDGQPDPFVARAYIYVAGLLDDFDRPAESLDYVRRSIAAAEPFGTDLYVAAAIGLGSVLSERGDLEAARYAGDAVARCRDDGSPDQLAVLLPTAAMVCWQVGAVADARAYLDEARPLHADTRRIARVVMLSTAAGLALDDGDLDLAIESGTQANVEATALGVEREVPLIRCVLARACLARDDLGAAAGHAIGALATAVAMTVTFPLALCLETASLVLVASGATDVGDLLATARAIRVRGDRPAPAGLGTAVSELVDRLGLGVALDPAAAAERARSLLVTLAGSHAATPAAPGNR